ncbi:uncharacterized protein [Triticum aestivum]|uniref:Uncharacterized protein n=2 Tax=Triticum TaxID=4564 RepID=A0A9R0VR82_TRITD|nr:uncharacterized protein LOC123062685 [Triticum aestivum]VAH65946.1 unnamed protein product [Triticum turgidum subsp. durum]
MPQVDLESLVCGGAGAGAGDRKVSCETVIAGGDSGDASPPRRVPPPPPDHDFPPESITIRIGDDAAFSELNPIYERDDSTKGSTNPKSSAAAGGACNPVPLKARSNSARVAGGPAAATATFFGLPARIRPAFTRRQPSQGRILPDKRSGGTGEEPRSPKVSCIGKVLSDRERCGRRRQRRWWRGVAAVFRCGGGGCASRGVGGGAAGKKMALEGSEYDEEEKEASVAAMRKFKSGRRAATWGEEALAAAAAEAFSGEPAGDEEKKHERHEAEHWARLPVS